LAPWGKGKHTDSSKGAADPAYVVICDAHQTFVLSRDHMCALCMDSMGVLELLCAPTVRFSNENELNWREIQYGFASTTSNKIWPLNSKGIL
jgi:hypothetical protein